MIIPPAHGDLNDFVQLVEICIPANQDPALDERPDSGQCDLELADGWVFWNFDGHFNNPSNQSFQPSLTPSSRII